MITIAVALVLTALAFVIMALFAMPSDERKSLFEKNEPIR